MKKRSRWILILSALLCLCMLFASCQSGNEPQDESSELETTLPEEAVPENEKVEYDKIVAEWTKYLKYEPSTKGGLIEADQFFAYDNTDNVQSYGGGFYVRTSVVDGQNCYNIYNVYSGKKIVDTLYGNYSFATCKCIIEIREYNNGTYTYNYLDSNGDKINEEPLTEAAEMHNGSSANTCSVLDRGYQVSNGRIVATYKAGQEIDFPAAKEYNGNKYVIERDSFVKVFDKNNKKIAEATFEGADDSDCYILSNGNVLLVEEYSLPKNADKYTYERNDKKYDLVYHILDIKEGKVSEIPATFVIDLMITPAEADSELNLATVGNDYQFAQINKIIDGRVEAVADYVILNAALETTAELPKIVKNQTGIYGAIDANTLIITTETGEYAPWGPVDERWLYSVDLSKGSVEHYVNLKKYTPIDGGFVYSEEKHDPYYTYEYTVYDSNMNKLQELPANCDVEEMDGFLFMQDVNEDDPNWKLITIEDGQVKLNHVADEFLDVYRTYTVDDGRIIVIENRFYNERGELLIDVGEGSYDVTEYSDNLVVRTWVEGIVTYYTVG